MTKILILGKSEYIISLKLNYVKAHMWSLCYICVIALCSYEVTHV